MKKVLLIALALFLFGCFINLVDRYGMVCIIVIAVLGLLLFLAKKKGLIKWPVSQPKKEDRTLKEETFYAVGVSYYENNTVSLPIATLIGRSLPNKSLNEGESGERYSNTITLIDR